jgi:uracil-DNA glycosylase
MKALSVHTDSKDRLRAFFVRALGQEWDELLRSGLAVLHAVKCAIVPKTAEEDERQHQNPPRRVVTRCAPPHFAEEFRELNAPVVVTLGVAALVAVRAACGSSSPKFLTLPLKEFEEDDLFRVSVGDRTFDLIVTTHPFADWARAMRDVRRAAALARIACDRS